MIAAATLGAALAFAPAPESEAGPPAEPEPSVPPEGRAPDLEAGEASPEAGEAAPEGRDAAPEGRDAAPEGRDAAPEGRGTDTAPSAAARGPARAGPPPQDYDPDSGIPPGGYYAPGQAPESEPRDGHEKLIAAYVLLPLGTLAMASGAALTHLTAPGHCPERLQALGTDLDPDQCRGLFIYNVIRTSYGGLMLISGAVLLAVGLKERKKNHEWKKKRFKAGPTWLPGHGPGAVMSLRF